MLQLPLRSTSEIFTQVFYGIQDLCDQIWKGPEWAHIIGGPTKGYLPFTLHLGDLSGSTFVLGLVTPF